jgi:hypothetical protein
MANMARGAAAVLQAAGGPEAAEARAAGHCGLGS